MPPPPPAARPDGLTASARSREWSVTAGPRPARAPGRDRAASDWHKARRRRPCAGGSQDHRLARDARIGSQTGAAARATAEAGGSRQGKHQVRSDAKPTLRRSEGARPFPPRPRGKGAPGAPRIPESRGSGRSAAGALWTEGRPLRPRTERQCHRMDAAAGGGVKAPDQSARAVSSRPRRSGHATHFRIPQAQPICRRHPLARRSTPLARPVRQRHRLAAAERWRGGGIRKAPDRSGCGRLSRPKRSRRASHIRIPPARPIFRVRPLAEVSFPTARA